MHIEIRDTVSEDRSYLVKWLEEPDILRWFPLTDMREIEDAVRIWMFYAEKQASLTAVHEGKPCGMITMYLHPYRKLAHQSLFAIIVEDQYRGKGIGTKLLKELMKIARERFQIHLLHLEVYEGNPAIGLYQKLGFTVYGKQERFVKLSSGNYLSKIMMQKELKEDGRS